MHLMYSDILVLTDKKPIWFDEYAVPRFEPFHPDRAADIYADEVVLLEIACQNCKERFDVAMSSERIDRLMRNTRRLAEQIADKSIHYGDPPNMDCCPAGPTMNCYDVRVIEYWRKGADFPFDFERDATYEVEIEGEAWN